MDVIFLHFFFKNQPTTKCLLCQTSLSQLSCRCYNKKVRLEVLTWNWDIVWASMRRLLRTFGNIRSRSPRRPTGCPGPLQIGPSSSSAQHIQDHIKATVHQHHPPKKKPLQSPQHWTQFQELPEMKQKLVKYKGALNFIPFAGFNAYSAFPLNHKQLVLFLGFVSLSLCLSANCIMLYLAADWGIFLPDPKSIFGGD